MRPASMEAAVSCDHRRARQISSRFTVLLGGIAAGYGLWMVLPSPWNPIRFMIPLAFSVSGLVAVSVLAALANGLSPLYVSELVASGQTRNVAVVQGVAALGRGLTAALAPAFGAFTVPAAAVAAGILRIGVALRKLSGIYQEARSV